MDINGKKIAVVGVSSDENKYGHKIFRDLLDAGYDVAGVNPNGGKILGKTMYKSVSDMEHVPDIIVTVVPPQAAEKVVREAAKKGVKAVWMQPGSESPAAVEAARAAGMDVTFNNCIMVASEIW